MKCKKCGKELVTGAKFCMFCGMKVGLTCPQCGKELPDVAEFCFNCGAKVKSTVNTQSVGCQSILNTSEMEKLSQIKKQEEENVTKYTGAPVWDDTPNGSCDCAVGECDCDGSIWS